MIANITNFGLIGFAMTPILFGEIEQVGQAERNASAQPIAFTHTTLIDMTAASLLSDMTVLVSVTVSLQSAKPERFVCLAMQRLWTRPDVRIPSVNVCVGNCRR
jgi:hypothetical protein